MSLKFALICVFGGIQYGLLQRSSDRCPRTTLKTITVKFIERKTKCVIHNAVKLLIVFFNQINIHIISLIINSVGQSLIQAASIHWM